MADSPAAAVTSRVPRIAGDTDGDAPTFHIKTEKLYALVPQARERSTLGAYLTLVPNKHWMIPLAVVLINLRHSPTYILPLLSGYLLNLLATDPDAAMRALPRVLAATFGLCVLNVASTFPQRLLLSRQRRALTASLRRALMRRVHVLTFAFHDRNQIGELQNKFVLDMNRLEGLQNYLFEVVLMQGTSIIIMTVIMGMKDWRLLMLMLLAVPTNLMIWRFFWKPLRAKNEAYRKAESGFSAFLFEALSGVRVTRAHAVESFTEDRVGIAASSVAARGYQLDKLQALFGSMAWAGNQLVNMIVYGTAVYFCCKHWITIGDLLVIMAYFALISQSIGSFLDGTPAVAAAHDAMNSLSELFERDDHEHNAGKPRIESLRGEVRLENVTFRYPKSTSHSLNGLDLVIPAGTSVALVGASGSGKSTTAGLILGFYEPTSGVVTIDGHDLTKVDRQSIRRHVGVVSQDVVLFHDTVVGNIAWGDAKPDLARVEEAARCANAHDFIVKLPDGYQHVLGDRGAGLSGGQRQRLAIARALYRDPKLLILDEATSALDPESEREVQQALDLLMKGRTTVVIAHRLSTVRNADMIVVLDEGRVIESGRFAELIERRGKFHELAAGQLF